MARNLPFVEAHERIIDALTPKARKRFAQIIREAAYSLAHEPQASPNAIWQARQAELKRKQR